MYVARINRVLGITFIVYTQYLLKADTACSIQHCLECSSPYECSVCELGTFGEMCQYECRANFKTCFKCGKTTFLKSNNMESECFNCRINEYFAHGKCEECPSTCMTCVNSNNCTECHDGWLGHRCHCSSGCASTSIESEWCSDEGVCLQGCVDGKRGTKCDVNCPNSGRCFKCEQVSGKCTQCSVGYYGDVTNCDKVCGRCKPNTKGYVECDFVTGICPEGCVDGYFGDTCNETCGKCLPDQQGIVKCDMKTGYCISSCVQGYYGSRCDKSCGHCFTNSTSVDTVFDMCSKDTGICNGSCTDGFYGVRCDKGCSHNCYHDPSKTNKCDKETSDCKFGCRPGHYGRLCELTCSQGCFDDVCDQISGVCSKGCGDIDLFGDICNQTCSSNCFNGSCNRSNLFCTDGCASGWHGPLCDKECSVSCSNKSCDQDSGYCDNRCVVGFYGNECEFNCSSLCRRGSCDRDTANCTFGCYYGYGGPLCNVTIETDERIGGSLYWIIGVFVAIIAMLFCIPTTVFLIKEKLTKTDYFSLKRTMHSPTYEELRVDGLANETSFTIRDKSRVKLVRVIPTSPIIRMQQNRVVSGVYDLPDDRHLNETPTAETRHTIETSQHEVPIRAENRYTNRPFLSILLE